jgi:DNA-binding response OmpR family regulator
MDIEATIIVVDDDPLIREMLDEYLSGQGYRVHLASGGTEMRQMMTEIDPQLVLLDLNLGGEDGLSLTRFLREHYQLGIIMLTGSDQVVDRIVGLEIGADDYITKPFDLRELLARIRSVLRRTGADHASKDGTATVDEPTLQKNASRHISFGDCILDTNSQRLINGLGSDIPITAMEFDLLRVFGEHPDKVLTRDQILNLTQHRDWDPYDRSVDIRIARLRKKIETDAASPQVIRTVRGAGYIYVSASQEDT